jgi:hypothetical protein
MPDQMRVNDEVERVELERLKAGFKRRVRFAARHVNMRKPVMRVHVVRV